MVAFTAASLALLAALPSALANRFVIKPADHDDLCVAANSSVPANGTAVVVTKCIGDMIFWNVTADGSIVNTNNTLCLDQKDARRKNGNPLQLWECASANTDEHVNQNFTLVEKVNATTNETQLAIQWGGRFCADLTDGADLEGTRVQSWRCAKNGRNQQWVFYDVTEASAEVAVDDEDDSAAVFNAFLAAQFAVAAPANATENATETATDAWAEETTAPTEGDAASVRRRHNRRVTFGSHQVMAPAAAAAADASRHLGRS